MKTNDPLWDIIIAEAQQASLEEPLLEEFFRASILDQPDLHSAISFNLSQQLASPAMAADKVAAIIAEALAADSSMGRAARSDIRAYVERDAACDRHIIPILYFKGFQALQLQRIAHWLWGQGRTPLALFLQNQVSETFAVDIHPGAAMGCGIMLDHATGLVIGETAVVGDNVSILHSVTLGGSGCQGGKRHPKVGDGVMISAGAKILGNISIGEGVKVGAGSLVLETVPAHVTVVGVPAKIVGRPSEDLPALEMDQSLQTNPLDDHKP
jgi:serine O-acetyltransferase